METVTQFVSRSLGLLPYEPPEPKRGARYAADARCWLCGGATDGMGWPQSVAIAPTFTQHNTAKAGDSDAVCQGCAALTRADTFQGMIKHRGLPIKIWTQCGWHSYSHFIREDGHYEAPSREVMRAIALSPPQGRWVLAINTTGQKHTLFRGAVASNQGFFPVQMDETTIWCRKDRLAACMADFEALAALGFSKDSILSGVYHPAQMLKVGLARWEPAESRMAPWRSEDPDMLALVHLIALGPAKFPEIKSWRPERMEIASAIPALERPSEGQMELF